MARTVDRVVHCGIEGGFMKIGGLFFVPLPIFTIYYILINRVHILPPPAEVYRESPTI